MHSLQMLFATPRGNDRAYMVVLFFFTAAKLSKPIQLCELHADVHTCYTETACALSAPKHAAGSLHALITLLAR